MKRGFFIFLLVLIFNVISAQNSCITVIDSINHFSASLYDNTPDSSKKLINSTIEQIFRNFLLTAASSTFKPDSLKFIKVSVPDDVAFKIFTWAVPLNDGSYLYSGFLQITSKKVKSKAVIKLDHSTTLIDLFTSYSQKNWPGAVYYRVIVTKSRTGKFYTLFGWRGSKPGTSGRIIETLFFDETGNPVFGKPVFTEFSAKMQSRVIFEFTDRVPFHLAYENQLIPGSKKKKHFMIIFNRLVAGKPEMGIMSGVKTPDYSIFDGFVFKDDSWVFIKDIDARMPVQNNRNIKPPQELDLAPTPDKK